MYTFDFSYHDFYSTTFLRSHRKAVRKKGDRWHLLTIDIREIFVYGTTQHAVAVSPCKTREEHEDNRRGIIYDRTSISAQLDILLCLRSVCV